MPSSKQSDDKLSVSASKKHKLLGQKSREGNEQPNHARPTLGQQRKRDAMDLAELIYDIFKDSLSNAIIKKHER
jgi:hypothetical protein